MLFSIKKKISIKSTRMRGFTGAYIMECFNISMATVQSQPIGEEDHVSRPWHKILSSGFKIYLTSFTI